MFLTYLTRRLALSIIALFGVVVVAFLIAHMVPADPLAAVLSDQATKDPAVREAYMKRWGLDRPVPEQFVRYLANVLRGDLGESFTTRRPVLQDLKAVPSGDGGARGHRPGREPPVRGAAWNLGGPASQPLGRSPDARGVSRGRGGADLLDGPDRPPRLLLPSRVGARAGSARHAPPDATGRHGLRPRRQPPHRGWRALRLRTPPYRPARPRIGVVHHEHRLANYPGGTARGAQRGLRTDGAGQGAPGDPGGGCARAPQRPDSLS